MTDLRKRSNRIKGWKAKLQIEKQERAKARQSEHDALSTTEKITKAKSRHGSSLKEINRLTQGA